MKKIKKIISLVMMVNSMTISTINGMISRKPLNPFLSRNTQRSYTTMPAKQTLPWWDPRGWKIFNPSKQPVRNVNNSFKFWQSQNNNWFSTPDAVLIFNPDNQEQANLMLDETVTNPQKIKLLNETITNTPNKQFFIEWAKNGNNLLLICQNSTPTVGGEILYNLMSLKENNDLIKAFIDQAHMLYNTTTGKWFIDNLLQQRALIKDPITGQRVRTLGGPLHALANQLIFHYHQKNKTQTIVE